MLQQALGPHELERQEREADRDHEQCRTGQDEHREPGEQHREAGCDEEDADDERPPAVTLALALQALDDAGLGGICRGHSNSA
jgi:hypothetical protein